MGYINVYGEGTVTGTGAAALTGDSADSSTDVNAGDTLIFDTGTRTLLDIDETVAVDDVGSTGVIQTTTTLDGNTIGPSNNVELNYAFLTEDPSGNLFTVWVFAYDNSDEDQFYLISDMGTSTRNGSGEIETVTQTTTAYSGQVLTVLDGSNLASGATTDTALNDFMLGDGSLTFNPANNDLSSAFGLSAFANIVCLTKGTLVDTPMGPRVIETLSVGDWVVTQNGWNKIAWIDHRSLTKKDLSKNPKLRPVRILAGALGHGLPQRDLLVSRQHRMMVRSKIAMRMFGVNDVLVAAIQLTKLPGIYVDKTVQSLDYFHVLFDRHEVIFAECAPTESLLIASEAMKAIGSEAREEITQLFPDLDRDALAQEPACLIPCLQQQNKLIERHAKNNRPLLEGPVHRAGPIPDPL